MMARQVCCCAGVCDPAPGVTAGLRLPLCRDLSGGAIVSGETTQRTEIPKRAADV